MAALRRVGFGDAEIFEIVMVTAYYALRCRMADGLGVELDTRVKRDATLVEAFAYRNKTDHRAARLGDSMPSNRSSLAAPMIAQGL